MRDTVFQELYDGIISGRIVPYLGAGALRGATHEHSGESIPADSNSLIIAMNDGKPMAPKLMYEFPRAAMNLELKRGRSFVNKFLCKTYGENTWTRAPLHDFLAQIRPHLIVDINRDTQLQQTYKDVPHTLIVGVARISGTDYRFRIYNWDGSNYREVSQEQVDTAQPILFKPMGSPEPEPNFIASDADYVDYITELMGGFAIPSFLKEYRQGKQYLFMGMRMTRDTERMVLSDITYASDKAKGWALIPDANAKEKRFCARQNIEIIPADISDFLSLAGYDDHAERFLSAPDGATPVSVGTAF